MKKLNLIFILLLFVAISACEDWVTDVDPYIDRVVDDVLNDEGQIDFMVTGLVNQRNFTVDNMFVVGDALSDQLYFDRNRISGATYQSFEDIDNGDVDYNNGSSASPYRSAEILRMMADTLVDRANNKITFTDNSLKQKALYNGYLYGAYARYLLASYFGRAETTGGATISLSPFIPSATLYSDAVTRFQLAITNSPSAWDTKVANSLIARIHLVQGNYATAATAAAAGLVSGDNALNADYDDLNGNYYRDQAGENRFQLAMDDRFKAYVAADPNEANRIVYTELTYKGNTALMQEKYSKTGDVVPSIKLIGWQEVNLMKAELVLRGAMTGDALALVNEVRGDHNIAPVLSIVLNDAVNPSIYVERDKELNLTGIRLLDQRRFGTFHLTGMWQYFPIPRAEADKNPNYNP